MNQTLPIAANCVLSSPKGTVKISYDHSDFIDISLTAFLLTNSDKVQGDSGIVFYNQPKSSSGVGNLLQEEVIGNTKVYKMDFDMSKAPKILRK